MNPSVSRILRRDKPPIMPTLGMVQGGELVTVRATARVKGAHNIMPQAFRSLTQQLEKLRNSRFDTTEDLESFSQKFDEGVKKVFSISNSTSDQYVKFGSPRDNDLSCGIRAGRLALTG